MIENSHINALETLQGTNIEQTALQTDPHASLVEDSPLGEDSNVGHTQVVEPLYKTRLKLFENEWEFYSTVD